MEVGNAVHVRRFTWKIVNFSSINGKKLYSEVFYVGGYPWRVLVFPKGNGGDQISIYLAAAEYATGIRISRYAQFTLTLVNQVDFRTSITRVTRHEFIKEQEDDWGFISFLPISQLLDPKRGYIVNDACLVEAIICTDRNIDLENMKMKFTLRRMAAAVITTDPTAVLSSPQQDKTKSTNLNLPAPQSSSPSDTIGPEEEKDMDIFFTNLEHQLSGSNTTIVYSLEAVKKALVKIEEALNIAPANFHASGNSFSLKEAFKILSSFDCSSSTITEEQKKELLAMEESFKELPDRAAKAAQHRNLLLEKESVKRTLTCNLELSVLKFKEAKAEVEKVDQEIAELYKKVVEAQKKKGKMLSEKKEIFRISKKLKMEMEAVGKELPEYEAKAKVAEVEEKTVVAEWAKMKDIISSIKQKI